MMQQKRKVDVRTSCTASIDSEKNTCSKLSSSIVISLLLLLIVTSSSTTYPWNHVATAFQPSQLRQPLSPFVHRTSSTTTISTAARRSPLFFRPADDNKWRSSKWYDHHHSTAKKKRTLASVIFMARRSNNILSHDQWMQQLPSEKFIQAVETVAKKSSDNNNNNAQVIASDVAVTAGISLSQASRELTTLASLTAGDIAVTDSGELLYTFPNNIQSVLKNNSLKYKVLDIARKVWPAAFWLIRISFGITLLVSLVAIFSAIFFIQTSSSSSSDRDDDRRGGGGGFGGGNMNLYWGPSPLDFFFYRPYGYYGYYNDPTKDPDEMGFLESVFSYVFGDGNPNPDAESKRLQLAANMIRENNGAVTAEQLAPYCDDIPSTTTSSTDNTGYVDESYVLPIVTALKGEPTVTSDGDIVYLFPDLQMSTTSTPAAATKTTDSTLATTKESLLLKKVGLRPTATSGDIIRFLNYNGIGTRGIVDRKDLLQVLEDVTPPLTENELRKLQSDDPTVFTERTWDFSLAPGINKYLAGGLGIVNLGGALYLGNILGQYFAMYAGAGVAIPTSLVAISGLYPFLLGYAVLFNAIPLARNIWINSENTKITARNEARKSWRQALTKAVRGSRLYSKLQSAKSMQQKMKQISTQDVVYDTRQSTTEELALQKEQQMMKEFDKELLSSKSSTTTSDKDETKKSSLIPPPIEENPKIIVNQVQQQQQKQIEKISSTVTPKEES